MSHRPGLLNSLGGEMNFVMQRVDYDPHRGRAYVEFREPDGDGGDLSQPPSSPIEPATS
jgi:hypothetical protein